MKTNQTIKRTMTLSWMLTAMMMLLTALPMQAAEYGIKIDGQAVTDENKADLTTLGVTVLSLGVPGKASYDSDTKTLTLKYASITGTGNNPALEIDQDELTIVVIGYNDITSTSGYGMLISGTSSHVTLVGSGQLCVSGTNGVFIGQPNYYDPQTTKLTVQGPSLIVWGNTQGPGSETGFGIRGAGPGFESGELELLYGTIQAKGSNDGTNYYASLSYLHAFTYGDNAVIQSPDNALLTPQGVAPSTWEGYDFYKEVVIGASRTIAETPLSIQAWDKTSTVTIKNPNKLSIGLSMNGSNTEWKNDAEITVQIPGYEELALYGNNKSYCPTGKESEATNINFDNNCVVYGNIMSLIQSEGFSTLTVLEGHSTFKCLFKNNDWLNIDSKQPLLLPALQLTPECYMQMFQDCGSLREAPDLPATTLKPSCYDHMFYSCLNLQNTPELLAQKLETKCYNNMFRDCWSVSYIRCMATDISADQCTTDWLAEVSTDGTFCKSASFGGWPTGVSGIPAGWTTEERALDAFDVSFSTDHIDVVFGEDFQKPWLNDPYNLDLTYTSSNPAVATVNAETGDLTIIGIGRTTIMASYGGDANHLPCHISYTVRVTSNGETPKLAFDREGIVASPDKPVPAVALTITDGLTAYYSIDNPSVAIVDVTTGTVTPRGTGVATVTATTDGNTEYKGATAKYYLMVLTNGERVLHDANNDGNVTITDAVSVVDYILNDK